MAYTVCDIDFDEKWKTSKRVRLFPYEEVAYRRRVHLFKLDTILTLPYISAKADTQSLDVLVNIDINMEEINSETEISGSNEVLLGLFLNDGFEAVSIANQIYPSLNINVGFTYGIKGKAELDELLIISVGRELELPEISAVVENYAWPTKATTISLDVTAKTTTEIQNITIDVIITIEPIGISELRDDFIPIVEVGPSMTGIIAGETEIDFSISFAVNILNAEIDAVSFMTGGYGVNETDVVNTVNILGIEPDSLSSVDLQNVKVYTELGEAKYLVKTKTDYDNILLIDEQYGSFSWFKLDQCVISANSQILSMSTFKANAIKRLALMKVLLWCPNVSSGELSIIDMQRFLLIKNKNQIIDIIQDGDTPEIIINVDESDTNGIVTTINIH